MPVQFKANGQWDEYARELKALAKFPGAIVGTGVPDRPASGERAKPYGLTLSDLVDINEFGNRLANVPKRPIFRPAMRKNRTKYIRKLQRTISKSLRRGGTLSALEIELQSLADEMAEDVRRVQAAQNFEPPLSPRTVARKGHDIAWIEMGEVMASIQGDVRIGRRYVGHKGGGGRYRDELGRFAKSPGS